MNGRVAKRLRRSAKAVTAPPQSSAVHVPTSVARKASEQARRVYQISKRLYKGKGTT